MTPTTPTPRTPAVWRLLVSASVPSRHRANVHADLDERFEVMAHKRGATEARRWYRRQAIGFGVRLPKARTANSFTALRRASWARSAERFGADLRYAVRTLRTTPSFTIPALTILALAIAANSTILSIVDNVLFRGIPYQDADSVALVWDVRPENSRFTGQMPVSYNHFVEFRERDDLFAEIVGVESTSPVIAARDYAVRTNGAIVSGQAFTLLGAQAAVGRTLLPSDELPEAEAVAVLSHRLWSSAFGADPAIVGTRVGINNEMVTIVGVMADDFWFFDPYMFVRSIGDRANAQPDIYQPLLPDRDWATWDPDYPALRVFARLQPGVTVQAATDALTSSRAGAPDPAATPGVQVATLDDEVLGPMRGRLLALQGAVALVLLIASVNIMSLVLAKATARRGEFAVRAALGAGKGALVRLAIIETALLGLVGGALGLLLTHNLLGVVMAIAPRELPLAHRVAVDTRVALLTLTISLIAGIAAGLVAHLGIDFNSITQSLRGGSRSIAGGRMGSRARFGLVMAEAAMTLVLLIGAATMIKSFVGVWTASPGFETDSKLTFFVSLSTAPDDPAGQQFFGQMLDGLRSMPGVESAAISTHLPFTNFAAARRVVIGSPVEVPEDVPQIESRWITEDFGTTMGIPLVAGREFTPSDDGSAEPTVIVNRAFVDRFFPGQPADAVIGSLAGTVSRGEITQHRIIGVFENIKRRQLYESDRALLYLPLWREPAPFGRFVVRTERDPEQVIPAVRALAAEIDARQPLTEFYSLDSLIAESLSEETFYAGLLTAFGFVAFGLAAIGIYGSVAFSTRNRMPEIGVRLAFGARPAAIRRMLVIQGLAPAIVGVAAGSIGAVMLLRSLESLLHGVSTIDPGSFAVAALSFLVAAALAALLPARRAARVDPLEVLRAD